MEGRLEGYLDRGLEPGDYADTVRKSGGAGKLGGLRGALVAISKDPAQMAFGLGVGNVSDSALGTQFDGKYHRLYQVFLQSTMTYFIFELGLLGLMSILCFYYFLFRDSVFVAKNDDEFWNAIALGWTGVVLVILVGTAYHDPMESRALTMLFWYFAGIVVSRKTRVAQSIQEKSSKNRKAILGFGN